MKRAWTKAWIAVVAVCIAVTIYEIPNAVRVWRFSRGTMQASRHTGSGKLNIPTVVTDRLAAADPEAGDMLKYLLKYSAQNPIIEDLSALAVKYPQNEFVSGQLAEELAVFGVVDTRAALVFADNLLKLNGQNAHYRYLRGWILLTDPDRPGRVREALEEFELGHRLPQFYLPYSKYKERLDRLYEKAAVPWERPWLSSFYMDLARRVFRSDQLRRRLDENTFRNLNGSVVKIADRLVENAYDSETFLAGAALLGAGEKTRLKELDLPEAEAQQSRLRAAQGLALLAMHNQSFGWEIEAVSNLVGMLGIPLILLSTAVAFLSGVAQEFIPVRLRRRKPMVRKHVKTSMLINAAPVAILTLLIVLSLLKGREEIWPGLLVFVAAMFIFWDAMRLSSIYPANLVSLQRPRLWVAANCGSLWFTGTVLWMAGSLSVSVPGNLTDWLQNGAVLVGWLVLCLLVWLEVAYRPDMVSLWRRHGVGLITYWVVVLMLLHIGGAFASQMSRVFADPLSRYRPFPQATQDTYNRVILGQAGGETPLESSPPAGLPGRIHCAAPEDLGAFIANRRAAGEPISEKQLQKLLRDCNRDLRPILLAELADANAYDVLVIRAGWGDRDVKEQLDRIFQERLAIFRESESEPRPRDPSSLGELLKLAGTLARVSDGPEAQERFSYLMEQVVEKTRKLGTGPSLDDPRYTDRIVQPFWQALCELPPAQATALVKSYLRQTQFVDLFVDRGGAMARLADLLADADRELAQEVVAALAGLPDAVEPAEESAGESQQQRTMRLTRYRDGNSPQCLDAISAHLGVESIPLLLKYLDSSNDQLRAFVVWRVASLGYKWPREQLATLRKDSFWKVRLNALFACKADDLAKVLEDRTAVVRTVTQMLIQAKTR